MKICFIANTGLVHTHRWAKYFIDKGHEIHVISTEKDKVKGATNHNLTKIPKLIFITGPIQTRRIINKIKPDIVHAHSLATNGFFAARSGFHPLVVTAWGSDVLIAPKKSRIINRVVRFVLKKADLITCDGENTKAAMITLGAEPKKIRIIYFGIDTKRNNPNRSDEKLKRRLNVSDSPTLISLRNFEPIYDVETLINAIPLVLKKISNAKFIIVSNGTRENYLKELAKSLGVSSSIIFTGRVPSDEIPVYLASSDVYVSTALSDSGLAGSTAEAMACGLPVVVTDTGCNREWIKDGENGFIIPIKDSAALAERVIYLFENKDAMKRFGKMGRGIITERQDYYKEMGKMEKLYEELIKNDEDFL